MLRALDLFCGAGGTSVGLTAAGYDVTAYDNWADAIATHNANHLPAYDLDLSKCSVDWWREHMAIEQREYDLLWASPPCQGWSQGGKHLGVDDPRNGFPWALAAVEGVRPRLVLMENVRGLTFKKNLPYLESEVMVPLRELGYQAEWRLLNCADFGVPQKRIRLFIVARLDTEPAWPEQTHVESPHHEYTDLLPWVTMAEALGWGRTDAPSNTVVGGSSRTGGAAPLDGGANARKQISAARADGRWIEHPEAKRASGSIEVSVDDAAQLQAFPQLNTGGDWKKGGSREHAQTKDPSTEVSPTVRSVPSQTRWQFPDGTHKVVSPEEEAVFQSFPISGAPLPPWAHDEPAPTIGTTFGSVSGRKPTGGHRNLTLAEAKILQCFPEGYEFVGTKTSRYLQIGNAVPAPMALLLAEANHPLKHAYDE